MNPKAVNVSLLQQNLLQAGSDNSRLFSSLCVLRGRFPRPYLLILPITQPKTVLSATVHLCLSRPIVSISRTFPSRVTGRRWVLESVTILPRLRSWTCSRRLGAILDYSTLSPWVRSRYASMMRRLCWVSAWLASKSEALGCWTTELLFDCSVPCLHWSFQTISEGLTVAYYWPEYGYWISTKVIINEITTIFSRVIDN